MNIEIKHIGMAAVPVLENLYRTYIQEMECYLEPNLRPIDVDEHIRSLSKYWKDNAHWPYLIYVNGTVAGFCLVRKYPSEPDTYDMEQFFVADAFKRKGIGCQALSQLLELHPGKWLIRVLRPNEGALTFWRQSIESCVGHRGSEACETSSESHMHFIRFCTGASTYSGLNGPGLACVIGRIRHELLQ